MSEEETARLEALKLAIKWYDDMQVSVTSLEAIADKFYKYITTGVM